MHRVSTGEWGNSRESIITVKYQQTKSKPSFLLPVSFSLVTTNIICSQIIYFHEKWKTWAETCLSTLDFSTKYQVFAGNTLLSLTIKLSFSWLFLTVSPLTNLSHEPNQQSFHEVITYQNILTSLSHYCFFFIFCYLFFLWESFPSVALLVRVVLTRLFMPNVTG